MESLELVSGEKNNTSSSSVADHPDVEDFNDSYASGEPNDRVEREDSDNMTPQMVDDNEKKLKDRIAQCRQIIESLKSELNEEKSKLEKEYKTVKHSVQATVENKPSHSLDFHDVSTSDTYFSPSPYYDHSIYSVSVERKLNCDESLMEYEKQLQKYQNTLNMAQIEKKNAIRKQMLSKAYKLKLLEVENHCNIELLRVKQSLQCLEPLQMIASKWKSGDDDSYDYNNFDLIPRYSEISSASAVDISSLKDESDLKTLVEKEENFMNDDLNS